MHRRVVLLALTAILCGLVAAQEQGGPATGYAPLYVSLVRWSSLKKLTPGSPPPARVSARATGFPAAPQWSHAPLLRGAVNTSSLPSTSPTGGAVAADIRTTPKPALFQDISAFATPAPFSAQLFANQGRRLAAAAAVFNDSSSAAKLLRAGFPSSNLDPSGLQGLAVGAGWMLHGSGSVLSATPLDSSSGAPSGPAQQVSLTSFFGSVADGCPGGVYDPDVVYDQHARRFMVSATCGGDGRALLAVSSGATPLQSWFTFGLVADAVNTRLACKAPLEAAIVDTTRLTYTQEAVLLSLYSYCPSNPAQQGAVVLALPKGSVVKGAPNFFYAVYTSAEVADALAAAGGPRFAPDACRQLQPVVPLTLADASSGRATFLCEVPPMSSAARGLLVVALADLPTLWQYGGPDGATTAPLLSARWVALPDAPPTPGQTQGQPLNAPRLNAGSSLPRFWSGNAVQRGSRISFSLRTTTPSGRPAVMAGQLSVAISTQRANICPSSTLGASSARQFSWATNYTVAWGSAWDPNWAKQPRSVSPAGGMTTANLGSGNGYKPSAAITRPNRMTTSSLGTACTCYQCYWSGSYYLFGGYMGGAVSQPGFGYAGYGFQAGYYSLGLGQNGWTLGLGDNTCYVTCMRCWYYGYPGYNMGNHGSINVMQANGVATVRPSDISLTGSSTINATGPGAAAGGSLTAADVQRVMRPCNRAVTLSASLLQTRVVSGAALGAGMDLAQPVVAATANGNLLLAYSYSGTGPNFNPTDLGDNYYAGMGASVVSPNAAGRPAPAVLSVRRGAGLVAAAAPSWGDNSAIAVDATSGRVYAAVRVAAGPTFDSKVAMWVGMWSPSQLDSLAA